MTTDARVSALTTFGFTERQARFLVTVLLHAGVCLGRQYCTFAGIARGQVVHDFFRDLVARQFATAYPRAHGSTHLFHLHGKALYRAVGEPNNRHRRPTPLPRAIERLMVLDAVLAQPTTRWLATEREKVTHFTEHGRLRPEELPQLQFGHGRDVTIRYFPDKLPIGRDADGRTMVFLYLVTRRLPVDFRAFLHRHADVLRSLSHWRIHLVVPPHLTGAIPRYESALEDELATPLQPATVDELRWFFEQRRQAAPTSVAASARYQQALTAFGTPRFRVLYRMWRRRGNAALDATLSPRLAEALVAHRGAVACQVLRHEYQHLGAVAGTA